MGTTPTLGLPYPELSDTADVPRDVKALAEAIETAVAARSLPAGVIQMWPGATAPDGWFLCDGNPVPAASNPGLAAIFGQSGGNVSLPDLRGRVLVGAGALPGSSPPASATLRQPGGAASVALTSPAQLPAHAHGSALDGNLMGFTSNISFASHGIGGLGPGAPQGVGQSSTTNTGDGAAHDNMPPFYAVNHVIKGG